MAHNKLLPSSKFSRKYPDDPRTEVVEAAKSGDAELLNEVLEELYSAERISILAVHSYNVPDSPYGRERKTTPLIIAVKNGKLDCVKILLKYNADVEGKGDFEFALYQCPYFWHCVTPLCVAAAYGNLQILSCLVENGADINAAANSVRGHTPLMFAVHESHIDAVNYLLDQGADVNVQQGSGYTALHIAAANGYFNALRCLIKHGGDVNARNENNHTPLMLACDNVNGKVTDSILKNVGRKETSSTCNYFNTVALLINQGADVNLQDNSGYSALHFAAGSTFTALIIIETDVDIITGDNCPCELVPSFQGDNVNVVDCLLQNGANVDLQDKDGQTALFHGLRNQGIPYGILSSLLKNGANLNTSRNDKSTPLILATQSLKNAVEQLVPWLIDNGANVDPRDKDGLTALHHACMYGNSCEVLNGLIKHGANVNASTSNKVTPLMRAAENCNVNAVSLLIEHGANVTLQDEDGDTALHYTASKQCCVDNTQMQQTIETLLTAGASCLSKNSHGVTPLLTASNSGSIEKVHFLIQRPEITKEQRIDALELLGASLSLDQYDLGGFRFIKHGMKERFADPFKTVLKRQMEPIEAYQKRKECQTLEELAEIESDENAMIMESLVVKERILGRNSENLLKSIRCAATYYEHHPFSPCKCIGLYRHAMKIARCCNQSATFDLNHITILLENWLENGLPKEEPYFELLDQTVLDHDYELQRKVTKEQDQSLFYSLLRILQMLSGKKFGKKNNFSNAASLLNTICKLNLRDDNKNTLLHQLVRYHSSHPSCLYAGVVKLLLNAGFNNHVNAVNYKGDTALHIAVTLRPWNGEHIHLLTEMLEVLFDGGAHHDFVNNDGKTPMDMAQTDEARMILSERRKLELKCISARVVKKFGIPYLGVVPKTLEKYISMH